jgi:hypothetical protein
MGRSAHLSVSGRRGCWSTLRTIGRVDQSSVSYNSEDCGPIVPRPGLEVDVLYRDAEVLGTPLIVARPVQPYGSPELKSDGWPQARPATRRLSDASSRRHGDVEPSAASVEPRRPLALRDDLSTS